MKDAKGYGRKWHPDYKVVCLWASTSGKPCSCTMCGNPRRHFGNSKISLTLQERKANQREKSPATTWSRSPTSDPSTSAS
jgi:hypothetical protein